MDLAYHAWGVALAPYRWPAAWLAVLSLLAGFALAAWIGSRRFYRRNVAGVEEFRSYGSAVGHSLLEGVVRLIAAVFMTLGMLTAAVALAAFLFGRY